jgi:hypothetical protein
MRSRSSSILEINTFSILELNPLICRKNVSPSFEFDTQYQDHTRMDYLTFSFSRFSLAGSGDLRCPLSVFFHFLVL